jgi:hypothetical protein
VLGKGKEKKTKGKQGEAWNTIRQLFCCLIEYGELFELFPERCVFLIFFGLLGGDRIVFNEPGEVLGIIDLFAEHLFEASGSM